MWAKRVVFGVGGISVWVAIACGETSTEHVVGDAPDANANGGAGGTNGGAGGTTGGTQAGTGGASAGAGAMGGTGSGATGSGATGSGATGSGGFGGSCGRGGCILPTSDVDPIEPPGPVYCGGTQCADSEVCCITEQVCFDPKKNPEACAVPAPDDDEWGRKTCASNAHCGDHEFCETDHGCTGIGHCQPISNCGGCNSDDDYCRVCGCDGNTYPDQQTACLARASTVDVSRAACGETVTEGGGGDGGAGGSGGSSGGPGAEVVRVFTVCVQNAHCPDGQLCCPRTNRCYPEDTPYLCEEPPEGTNAPCLADSDCPLREYCWGESCDAPGGCVGVGDDSEDCGVTLEPVCGCDGTSYTSADCADERGVRVAHEGECGSED